MVVFLQRLVVHIACFSADDRPKRDEMRNAQQMIYSTRKESQPHTSVVGMERRDKHALTFQTNELCSVSEAFEQEWFERSHFIHGMFCLVSCCVSLMLLEILVSGAKIFFLQCLYCPILPIHMSGYSKQRTST